MSTIIPEKIKNSRLIVWLLQNFAIGARSIRNTKRLNNSTSRFCDDEGGSYSGSTTVSKTVRVGSIPTPPAKKDWHFRSIFFVVLGIERPEARRVIRRSRASTDASERSISRWAVHERNSASWRFLHPLPKNHLWSGDFLIHPYFTMGKVK